MADHWVAEVFPPKFQFETVDEILKIPQVQDREKPKRNVWGEIYRKVYCEEEKAHGSRNQDSMSRQSSPKKQTVFGIRIDNERKTEKESQYEDRNVCIWSQHELKMLRTFFQKAKMQNLKLAAMLESTQDEIKVWKEKYKKLEEGDQLAKSTLLLLKKKYGRLKVNYRALKDDVRRYHANLKVKREDYEDLKDEKIEIEHTLSQTKSELNKEKLKNEELQRRLERKEREVQENLKNVEYFLEQQNQLQKVKLLKEIDKLREEFEKEKGENDLNKKALEHLRCHFASLQMNQENVGRTKEMEEKVLSVIDIDYLPV